MLIWDLTDPFNQHLFSIYTWTWFIPELEYAVESLDKHLQHLYIISAFTIYARDLLKSACASYYYSSISVNPQAFVSTKNKLWWLMTRFESNYKRTAIPFSVFTPVPLIFLFFLNRAKALIQWLCPLCIFWLFNHKSSAALSTTLSSLSSSILWCSLPRSNNLQTLTNM